MSFATEFRQQKRDQRQQLIVTSVVWSVMSCALVGVVCVGVLVWQAEPDAPQLAQVKQPVQAQNRPKLSKYEHCLRVKDLQVRLTNAAVSPHRALGMVPEGFSEAMEYGTKSECDRFRDK
jgi:hypothetical protein